MQHNTLQGYYEDNNTDHIKYKIWIIQQASSPASTNLINKQA